jgi:hypothetical protein
MWSNKQVLKRSSSQEWLLKQSTNELIYLNFKSRTEETEEN